MKVIVESAVVQKNIKLFKAIIDRHLHPQPAETPPDLASYAAYINCVTGEILFAEETGGGKLTQSKKWKPICLRVRIFGSEGDRGFEILEEESNESLFQCDKLDSVAHRILNQMIQVLNTVFESIHDQKSLEKVLDEVVHLEFEQPRREENERDIVHEAWHQVSRIEAEKILETQAVGTFLFRKDPFAERLEEQLSMRFRIPMRCLTLTYLDFDEKVVDLTLVRFQDKWHLYEDDPSLEDSSFSSIPILLESLKPPLLKPLLYEL